MLLGARNTAGSALPRGRRLPAAVITACKVARSSRIPCPAHAVAVPVPREAASRCPSEIPPPARAACAGCCCY